MGIIDNEFLWRAKYLLGDKEVNNAIASAIESLFEKSGLVFYLSEDRKFLLSSNSERRHADFGALTEVSGVEAFLLFGIIHLEEAVEHCVVQVDYSGEE